MNAPFPFGFPLPTGFYLTMYVVTLVIHVVFMNYVLAGSAWLAVAGMFPGRNRGQLADSPISRVLRDWMPFAVSAAITAGVAPLLFIQILYMENFYTANLLLFHRWMAIVPVLIVGFYLTYLFKSKTIGAWPGWSRVLVGLAMFGCFLFAGLSWTENHLLALDRSNWPGFYGSGSIIYRNPDILPRLAMWTAGAFPAMATLVGWQLLSTGDEMASRDAASESAAASARMLALLAVIGLIIAAGFAALYFFLLPAALRETLLGPLNFPYLIAAGIGALAQCAAWHLVFHGRRPTRPLLALASAGLALTLFGMTVARETLRLGTIDIEKLYPQHAATSEKGGLIVFLAFFVINAVLIAWCLKLVRRRGE